LKFSFEELQIVVYKYLISCNSKTLVIRFKFKSWICSNIIFRSGSKYGHGCFISILAIEMSPQSNFSSKIFVNFKILFASLQKSEREVNYNL